MSKSKKQWKSTEWKILKWSSIIWITWIFCASAITIFKISYIACFIWLLIAYFWFMSLVLAIFYHLFKEKKEERDSIRYVLSRRKRLIILIITCLLLYLWWKLFNSEIISNICGKLALFSANLIWLPWWWEPIQIKLDNLFN